MENGFRPGRTTYHITFDDEHPLAGFDVRIRSCTIKEMRLMDHLTAGDVDDKEDREQQLTELFLGKLVSWNLMDDEGQPKPMTQEALDEEEPALLQALIIEWYKAMVTVNIPLPRDYLSGRSSQEASLGLASQSGSLEN